MHILTLGMTIALDPINLLYCFIGVLVGTLIGVLPGLGPAATVAILMPTTFNLQPVTAIIMLAGIYNGAMYGGSTTSILVNIPGEAASVVTCIDGHKMAQQGRAGAALGISAFGSLIGALIGITALSFLAPTLANAALSFGPPEYFSLMLVGMTLLVYLGSESTLKSLMMACVGIVMGCVGQDPILGVPRLTYGSFALLEGIDPIPVIMGFFGLSEILVNLEESEVLEILKTKIKGLLPNREDWRRSILPIGRGSVMGFLLGILPGGGAVLASFASYAVEKRLAKHPEQFGKGAIEGVAGPESANNAATMGALVPLFTLGIPSNVVIAMFLAALMIHGVRPGPLLIQQNPDLFWGVIMSMIIGNILLLALNLPMIGLWVKMLKTPYKILFPLITMFCLIGTFTVNSRISDMIAMLFIGCIGYLMRKYAYDAAPLILAFILGPLLENSLRQSLTLSRGSFGIFVTRPISIVCLSIASVLVVLPAISYIKGLFGKTS